MVIIRQCVGRFPTYFYCNTNFGVHFKDNIYFFIQQLYVGPRRGKTSVLHNRDVVKELVAGSIVALNHHRRRGTVPQLAKVTGIPPNPTDQSQFQILWLEPESASHKGRWLRFYYESKKKTGNSTASYSEVILYDIELTKKGALKKQTREYLQAQYRDLQEGEWKNV